METSIDPRSPRSGHGDDRLANALREMTYTHCIVGSRSRDDLNGMMADWVMQVSFRPRLLALALERDAQTLANIREFRVFTVNVLAGDSMSLGARFAQPYHGSKIRGRGGLAAIETHHKLEGVSYRLGQLTGCPILTEALAWLECRVHREILLGDHVLVVGEIIDGAVSRDASALTSADTGWVNGG